MNMEVINLTNLSKGEKMTEEQFTDIIIVGNNKSKSTRNEGKNKEGKDQYLITFSLSRSAKGTWIETFNRVWGEQDKQPHSLKLPVVRDDQIQIICPLDDQLQSHLDNLKRKVSTTNQVYREQLRAADDEKRNSDKILQTLRF
jgi:hypothetical protein